MSFEVTGVRREEKRTEETRGAEGGKRYSSFVPMNSVGLRIENELACRYVIKSSS